PYRAAIDRLANLSCAGSPHRPRRLVERQAGSFPLKPAVSEDGAGLALKVFDNVLVGDFEHYLLRQDGAPMCHQRLIGAIIAAKFAELIGVSEVASEQQGEAGTTGVDGIATQMDDARAR